MNNVSDQANKPTLTQIVEKLVLREEKFVTQTREEYDILFQAVLKGQLDDRVDLGRSGIWYNKRRVSPPS